MNHPRNMNFCTGNFQHQKGSRRCEWGSGKEYRKNIFKDSLRIQLYNLEEDIQELNDVSAHHPQIVQRIEEIFRQEHTPAEIERFKIKQLGD